MPTIDNKIVQMTFDNKQFERGVKESLHSLDELKKALDLDKSAQSLANLERAAENFDISGIANGVDKIADKFSLLGNIGQEIFHRISKTAVDAMQNVVHTITSMPQAGLSKYETKNKAVQMIQGALPDKSLAEIEAVLARLNEYTDLTSYDFAQMAQSIGKFTAAGIDLDVAERAMEGIANETASAGGEIAQANIAMYNFSQALSQGSVRLLDWRSIENQNLATKEFKEQIIETAYELGTLQKVQDKVGRSAKGTVVTYENLSHTLAEGWFTSDVLIKVLEKYADRESDVGKKGFEMAKVAITVTQAFDAIKDAISTQWMKSWQYLIGDLDEAGTLLTRISDAVIDFTSQIGDFRNNILAGWHYGGADGISGYTMAIEAMSNAWHVLVGIAEAAKGALIDVFGFIDAGPFIGATAAVRDFTRGLAEFFGYSEETITHTKKVTELVDTVSEWTQDLTRGMSKSDEVKKMQEYLLSLGNDLIRLDKYGADGIFGPETQAAVKAFQKSVGLEETGIYDKATRDALANLVPKKEVETVHETEETITHIGTGLDLIRRTLAGVFSIAKAGLSVIKVGLSLAGSVLSLFVPVGQGILSLAAGIGDLISYVADLATSLVSNKTAMAAFNAFLLPIRITLDIISGLIYNLGDGISKLVAAARQATSFESLGELLNLDPEKNKNAIAIYNAIAKIRQVLIDLKPSIDNIVNTLKAFFSSAKEWISGKATAAFESISKFFTDLWAKAKEGKYLEKVLAGVGTALKIVLALVGGVGLGIYNFAKAVVNGAVALFNFVKSSELVQNILGTLKTFFAPVGEFFTSVWQSITKIRDLIPSFKTFSSFWTSFIQHMRENPIGAKFVPALEKIKSVISKPIDKIKEFIGAIRLAFKVLTTKNKKMALLELLKDPKNSKGAYNILVFLEKVKNLLGKIKPIVNSVRQAISNVFGAVAPALKEFGGAVWGAIKNFFGGDGTSAGEKISGAFQGTMDWIRSTWDKISKWISSVVANSPFLQKLIAFGKMLGEAIKNFFTMDTSGAETAGEKLAMRLHAFDPVIDWVKEKVAAIKGIFTGEGSLLEKVKAFFSPGEGSVLGLIGDGIKGIGKVLASLNLSSVWDAAKKGFAVAVIVTIVRSISRFSKALMTLTGAKTPKQDIGKIVLELAISLGIIAGALLLLSKVPAKEALTGVGVMAVALTVLSGAFIAMSKFANIESIGKGLLSIALSIGIILLAIEGAILLIKGNKGTDLVAGLLLVAAIMAALTFVAKAINKTGQTGGSLGGAATVLAIAVSVLLIARAIGKMAKFVTKYKGKGTIAPTLLIIAGIVAALGTIAVLLSKQQAFGGGSFGGAATVLAIAFAVKLLVGAIGDICNTMKQYPNQIGWAFAMVEALLLTIGGIAVLLESMGSNFGFMSALASVAPILALGYAMEQIIDAMSSAIVNIADVDPAIVIAFLSGVEAAMITLGAIVVAFSAIPVTAFLSESVGFVALLTAIGLGLDIAVTFASDAMDKFSTALQLVGWRLSSFSESMETVNVQRMSRVLGSVVKVILPTVGTIISYAATVASAVSVGKDLWYFGLALGLFENSISGITTETGSGIKQLATDIQETVNTINGIEGLTEAKEVLESLGAAFGLYYGNLKMARTGANGESVEVEGSFDVEAANEAFQNLADLTLTDETIAKIKSYANDGSNNLNQFAEGIQNLGVALSNYGTNVSTLDSDKITTANGVLDKVGGIELALTAVSSFDTLFGILGGKRRNIADFGLDLAALGGALAKYGNSVKGLTSNRIDTSLKVLDVVAEINNKLPTTGGLWQKLITGEKSLSKFAVNMSDLGSGLGEFANKVSSANFTNVDASINPIRALSFIQKRLSETGGIKSLIEGTKDLGSLGSGLKSLGDDLAAFAGSGIKDLNDDDYEHMGKALSPVEKLAEAQSKIKGTGGLKKLIEGASGLGTLGQGLKDFWGKYKDLNDEMREAYNDGYIDSEHIEGVMQAISRLSSYQSSITGPDKDTRALYDLADGLYNFFWTIASLGTISNGSETSLSDQAISTIDTLMLNIAREVESLTGYYSDAGESFDDGLIIGLMRGQSRVINAAGFVAASALARALNVLGIRSPSTEMAWAGQMMDEGLAGGLNTYSKLVEDASGEVANNAINEVTKGLSGYSDIARQCIDSIDDTVTITPVLDLTEVASGASRIGNILDNGRIGASIRPSVNLANGINAGSGVITDQSGGDSNLSQIIGGLRADLQEMASTIANMQVVMDTGALVGQIAAPMDRQLGERASQSWRW